MLSESPVFNFSVICSLPLILFLTLCRSVSLRSLCSKGFPEEHIPLHYTLQEQTLGNTWIPLLPGINWAVQSSHGLSKPSWEGDAQRGTLQWQVPSPPHSTHPRHGPRHPHTLLILLGTDTTKRQHKSEHVWSCPQWLWGPPLRRAEQGLPEHGQLNWYLHCSPLLRVGMFLIWCWAWWAGKCWGWKTESNKKLLTFCEKIAYSVLLSREVALWRFIMHLPISKITWLRKGFFMGKA